MNKTPKATPPVKRSRKTRTTSSALEILDHRFTRNSPAMQDLVEHATVNALVAKLIYEARTSAKLTQKQLAQLAGTTQPVIARLEDSNYEGHSLSMLHRIAQALDRQINIQLVATKRRSA